MSATRVLGKWMNVDAAPVLLDLAQTLGDARLRTRTLRGYLRIARQLDLPAERRLAMCEEAFQAAQRDEEKRLAAEVARIVLRKGASGALAARAKATHRQDAAQERAALRRPHVRRLGGRHAEDVPHRRRGDRRREPEGPRAAQRVPLHEGVVRELHPPRRVQADRPGQRRHPDPFAAQCPTTTRSPATRPT